MAEIALCLLYTDTWSRISAPASQSQHQAACVLSRRAKASRMHVKSPLSI